MLIDGLRAAGAAVDEYCAPLSCSLSAARLATAAGAGKLAVGLARAHLSLPCAASSRRGDSTWCVVGYPGHLMVPFAGRCRPLPRALLVFDPLVSLFDTFAGDRGLWWPVGSAGGRAARAWSTGVAFGGADVVLADTAAQAATTARR